jgi:secreted PhoX family phosphatase
MLKSIYFMKKIIAALILNLMFYGTCHAETIYVSTHDNKITTYSSSGVATPFASDPGDNSVLNNPGDMAFDAQGNLYVSNNNPVPIGGTIEKFSSNGTLSTFVSNLRAPAGVAFDTAGNLFIANSNNGNIVKVTPQGVTSNFAQTGVLSVPDGLAFDKAGNLYVSTDFNTIEEFSPQGQESIFIADPGDHSILNDPEGLAFDSLGNLYVANNDSASIEKITPAGVASVFASGIFKNVGSLAFDSGSNLYVTDFFAKDVYKVSRAGTISLFAHTSSQVDGVVISPGLSTPEPASIALLTPTLIFLLRRRPATHQIPIK